MGIVCDEMQEQDIKCGWNYVSQVTLYTSNCFSMWRPNMAAEMSLIVRFYGTVKD